MLQSNTIFYILIYILFIVLFWLLRSRVKKNLFYYNQIPNMQKYQKSVFYIGDYETEFGKRRRKSLREGIFFLGGICIWGGILMLIFTVLFKLKLHSVDNLLFFSNIGYPIALVISLYLGVMYSSLFYFSKATFVTSVILCQTKLKRGEWLIRCMTHSLIFTIILMPFFLLSVENYCYVTEEKICLNRYFSLQEEEYFFEEIRELSIEKKCDKNGEIYDIACYIENKKGERMDILNSDLGEEMRKRIFENIEINNSKIIDYADLSTENIKKMLSTQ